MDMSNRVAPLPPDDPIGSDDATSPTESRPTGFLGHIKHGFSRYIGWKRLGIVASLLIVIFAVTALVKTLKGVDTWVIMTALTDRWRPTLPTAETWSSANRSPKATPSAAPVPPICAVRRL